MTNKLLFTLTLLSALGCGLIGGVFFAFSTFVMKALAALSPPQGIAAMKSINIAVLNPIFLGLFLGTSVGCIILVIASALAWHKPGAALALVGSVLYLVGTFLVTVTCNVPRNEALAGLDPAGADSAQFWSDYIRIWTAWNHVRTIAAIAASVLLMISLWFSALRHSA
jgi:uncharacterized membrane protein